MSQQTSTRQLGPQHRTAVALGLVIGLVLGAIGAGVIVFMMTRGTDTADVSDATLDARAACDILDRVSDDDIAAAKDDQGSTEDLMTVASRLGAAGILAEVAQDSDADYAPLGTSLGEAGQRIGSRLDLGPESMRAIERARAFCDRY